MAKKKAELTVIQTNVFDAKVEVKKNQPVTSSLEVARIFGKRHDDVLKSIRNLDCSEAFTARNFAGSEYKDPTGRKLPVYYMNKDGFMYLAMGYTGKQAAFLKETYIAQFNAMEAQLRQLQNQDWIEARQTGKIARRELTDEIKEFIEYAIEQGSTNAHRYYKLITNMEYRHLGLLLEGGKVPEHVRNKINRLQLTALQMAEDITRRSLAEGMAQEMPYKDIYKLASANVERYVQALPPAMLSETSSQKLLAA